MALTVKKGGVHTPTKYPWIKKNGYWYGAKAVFVKKSGTWREVWPRRPNPTQNLTIASAVVGNIVTITGNWAAPAAGFTPDAFYAILLFWEPISGAETNSGEWIRLPTSTFSYTFTNGGAGWQHLAGQWVGLLMVVQCDGTEFEYVRQSAYSTSPNWGDIKSVPPPTPMPPLPPPPPPPDPPPPDPTPDPTPDPWPDPPPSETTPPDPNPIPTTPAPAIPNPLIVDIQQCQVFSVWEHDGSYVDYWEVVMWLDGYAPTTYYLGAAARSLAYVQPWDPNTVGRNGVAFFIRAIGQGGNGPYNGVMDVMPGPLALTNQQFLYGSMYVLVTYDYDGVRVWQDYYGSSTWTFQADYGPSGGGEGFWIMDAASGGYPADRSTYRRMVFQPRNVGNGWTGRLQGSDWCLKIPNPVHILPIDCNTWWSEPIPGKWRDNPQAEAWFYQGKSISGNSYGCLFYQSQIYDYFSNLGYEPGVSSCWVYIQRTYTGGLVAPVALSIGLHGRWSMYDTNAAPNIVWGMANGPSLSRSQQAWVDVPVGWWSFLRYGSALGIVFHVDFNAGDNQLRPEIGNVSNRYMILNKPGHGDTLEGLPPGALKIMHNG